MSIAATGRIEDPYVAISWNMALAILALEKLIQGEAINSREERALHSVGEAVSSLLSFCLIKTEDLMSGRLDFSAMINHARSSSLSGMRKCALKIDPGLLQQANDDMQDILAFLRAKPAGRARLKKTSLNLKRAKDSCLTLLEQIDAQRPLSFNIVK